MCSQILLPILMLTLERTMNAARDNALPAIDILLVEDRVQMARQLATLLQHWGAASVQLASSVVDALAQMEHQPLPSLVLVDHQLGDGFGCVVALWLAMRPALRQATVVAVYTNSDQYEVAQSLQELVIDVAQPGPRTEQVLGTLTPAARAAAVERLALVRSSAATQAAFFDEVYDAYLSKRRSINTMRTELRQLCQGRSAR
jgi:CheY-like chemotaxis protein